MGGEQLDGVQIVERNGRPAAAALAMGWLCAGLVATSVEGAGGMWLMSLPFAVLAIGAALARRRVVRADPSGLSVRDLPFGSGFTLARTDIANVAADAGPEAEPSSGTWSVVVRTRGGEAHRLAGGRLTAERAHAIAARVRSVVG